MSIRPVLANDLTVRAPHPDDIAAMRQLELSAAIVRDDGTELVIDHNGRQFDHAAVASDHRYLAALAIEDRGAGRRARFIGSVSQNPRSARASCDTSSRRA